MTHNTQLLLRTVTAFAALLILSTTHASMQRGNIAIQGTRVHPESITSASDGTVWIGSYAEGTIYRAGPGESRAVPWIPAGTAGITNAMGVLADEKSRTLWVCSPGSRAQGDRPAVEASLKAFDLDSATFKSSHPSTGSGDCNDMAIAPDGTLYATDFSGGRVLRLKPGMTALELWAEGPELASADGIALLADGAVYVNTFRTNTLLRIPVNADGSAGKAVLLQTSRPLVQPDGMRAVGDNTLLLAEGEGRLTELVVSGDTVTVRVLRDGFTDGPAAVTLAGDTAFVVEARFRDLMKPDPGKAPQPFEAIAVPYGKQ